jgi:hypothetical protein
VPAWVDSMTNAWPRRRTRTDRSNSAGTYLFLRLTVDYIVAMMLMEQHTRHAMALRRSLAGFGRGRLGSLCHPPIGGRRGLALPSLTPLKQHGLTAQEARARGRRPAPLRPLSTGPSDKASDVLLTGRHEVIGHELIEDLGNH